MSRQENFRRFANWLHQECDSLFGIWYFGILLLYSHDGVYDELGERETTNSKLSRGKKITARGENRKSLFLFFCKQSNPSQSSQTSSMGTTMPENEEFEHRNEHACLRRTSSEENHTRLCLIFLVKRRDEVRQKPANNIKRTQPGSNKNGFSF